MCGRFTLNTPADDLAAAFDLPERPAIQPRFNVAPSQLVAVVGLKPDGKTRGLAMLRWGFVPYWANDPNTGPRPINARAETVASRPPFEHSFREKRCLIPADGFYEWATVNRRKVAHHFRMKSGGPLAFAGVWDVWRGEGHAPVLSCAIITVPANGLVRPYHDRMPAILQPSQYDLWLNNATPEHVLLEALAPFPEEMLEAVQVGPAVNKVSNDGPECLAPAA
jgi:putative SOS response-associated peptidase YedK